MTQPNPTQKQNMDMVRVLRQVARQKTKKQGYRTGIGALSQPSFVSATFGPMMQSKKLWRTNNDIRIAANLWCTNRSEAEAQYGNISDWDVSSVTDMSNLFRNCHAFNDDISRWDVSNVNYMSGMFFDANAFNQPIGNWNVSNVADMAEMFCRATAFNQPIGDWNVSNVIYMQYMFVNAKAFNQYLGNWNVDKVTDIRFNDTKSFNEYSWDLELTSMRAMFGGAISMETKNLPGPGRRWWKLWGGSKQTRSIQRKSKRKHYRKHKQTKKRSARKTHRG